ncbi:MAG TPA: hypothetical protein PLL20_13065 [Phycisphaerae bacterium]|nr:hypothetical protein [Phycisphaerae bacterium]
MIYRLLGLAAFLLWAAAMVSLFVHDVMPEWIAQDPPRITVEQFKLLDEPLQQYRIVDSRDRRLGTAWSEVRVNRETASVNGTVLLDGLSNIPALPLKMIPSIRIESQADFDRQGALEGFRLDVHGFLDQKIFVHGERRGIYFPVEMQFGPIRREVPLDYAASRMIGESLNPLACLPTLRLGQSWRMQMLDPLTAVLSGRTEFKSVVARVTGKEAIAHPFEPGRTVDCFIVETVPPSSKAWVDEKGRVFRQEADLPGVGRVTLIMEAYNEEARDNAKSHKSMGRMEPQGN